MPAPGSRKNMGHMRNNRHNNNRSRDNNTRGNQGGAGLIRRPNNKGGNPNNKKNNKNYNNNNAGSNASKGIERTLALNNILTQFCNEAPNQGWLVFSVFAQSFDLNERAVCLNIVEVIKRHPNFSNTVISIVDLSNCKLRVPFVLEVLAETGLASKIEQLSLACNGITFAKARAFFDVLKGSYSHLKEIALQGNDGFSETPGKGPNPLISNLLTILPNLVTINGISVGLQKLKLPIPQQMTFPEITQACVAIFDLYSKAFALQLDQAYHPSAVVNCYVGGKNITMPYYDSCFDGGVLTDKKPSHNVPKEVQDHIAWFTRLVNKGAFFKENNIMRLYQEFLKVNRICKVDYDNDYTSIVKLNDCTHLVTAHGRLNWAYNQNMSGHYHAFFDRTSIMRTEQNGRSFIINDIFCFRSILHESCVVHYDSQSYLRRLRRCFPEHPERLIAAVVHVIASFNDPSMLPTNTKHFDNYLPSADYLIRKLLALLPTDTPLDDEARFTQFIKNIILQNLDLSRVVY